MMKFILDESLAFGIKNGNWHCQNVDPHAPLSASFWKSKRNGKVALRCNVDESV